MELFVAFRAGTEYRCLLRHKCLTGESRGAGRSDIKRFIAGAVLPGMQAHGYHQDVTRSMATQTANAWPAASRTLRRSAGNSVAQEVLPTQRSHQGQPVRAIKSTTRAVLAQSAAEKK